MSIYYYLQWCVIKRNYSRKDRFVQKLVSELMMITDGQPLISGIGNEVLIASAAIVVLLSIVSYFTWTRRSHQIHPLSRDVIDSVRNALRAAYQSATGQASGEQLASEHQRQLNRFNMDNQCPVCLNEPVYPVETNCGHIFCAQCIIVYSRHNAYHQPVPCPVCRQIVNLLLICFRRTLNSSNESGETQSSENRELQQIISDINDYNRRFSRGPRPVSSFLQLIALVQCFLSLFLFHESFIEFLIASCWATSWSCPLCSAIWAPRCSPSVA